MKRTTVEEILKVTGGKLYAGNPAAAVENLTTDSRNVPTDALFVPIAGENFDGHQFIAKALENGAKAVISAKEEPFRDWLKAHPESEAALILTGDTLEAVQRIGKYARSKLMIRAIGVTGSVGKTTTREMIAAALSAEKKVYRTGKNYNNKLGVPITLCEMSDDYDLAVLELGLNVPGELGTISALTDLSCAVITNIGVAHMEFYGDRDKLTEEKFTVTRGFFPERKEEKLLILNGDDQQLMKYRNSVPYRTVLYGTGEHCAYRAVNIRPENGCYAFDLVKNGETLFPVTLSAPGRHNVLNALAAFAAADYFGVDLEKAAASLSGFTGFKGRLERHEKDGILYIDDTYNASPDSMKAGLRVLYEMKAAEGRRKIAVLGDMLELGRDSGLFHREVGLFAAECPPDEVFLLGKEAEKIGEGMKEAAPQIPFRHFDAAEALKDALLREVRAGDIVYFKASHGMHFSALVEEILKA